MNTSECNENAHTSLGPKGLDRSSAERVFAEPVAYLTSFGIEVELVVVESLPTAA